MTSNDINKLKRQVGQLFVIGYQGQEPSDDFLRFVEEWGIGGVIVFARNLENPEQLPTQLHKIQEAAGRKIFTSIDQEGGLVLRILKNGSLFPSAMGLAATQDIKLIEKIYEAVAQEMQSFGLNWNLAPVLDINHPDNPGIGARSFGDTPGNVAKYGCAAIRGLQKGGVLACAKHFPGKGHAKVDSHLTLPTIPYDRKRLDEIELFPFKKAIENNVAAIMTAHVFFPAIVLDKNLPATLSPEVLTTLLRKDLGFEGLLITDDLEMGAITESFGIADAANRSFLAGADLLLICHQLQQQQLAAETVLQTITESPDAYDRLQESIQRIEKAREALNPIRTDIDRKALTEQHRETIETAYNSSIRFFTLDEQSLPIKSSQDICFICPEIAALVQVEESHEKESLKPVISKFYPKAKTINYSPKANVNEILRLFNKKDISQNSEIIFFTYNGHLFKDQLKAVKEILAQFPNLFMVALRNPFEVNMVDKLKNSAATFGFRTPAIEAVLKTLTGELSAQKSPWPIKI